MAYLIDPYRVAGPLASADGLWIAKDTATFYDSVNDRLTDQVGSNHLQLGATSGSDTTDPVFGDDGTYEHLSFDGSNDYMVWLSAALDFTGDFTVLIVATSKNDSGSPATGKMIFTSKSSATGNGLSLFYSWNTNEIKMRSLDGSSTSIDSSYTWSTTTPAALGIRRSGSSVTAYYNGSTSAAQTNGSTITGDVNGQVGRRGASDLPCKMYLNGVATWDGLSLSDTQMADAEAAILDLAAV